ncbi:MAG TPA: hypothetical protein VF070_04835 [Streptosporangiaceae bacterium]
MSIGRRALVIAEAVRPASAVQHAEQPGVTDLQHQQCQRGGHDGEQHPALARGRADRGGGEDRGGGGYAHHHLAVAGGLAEHQPTADEADAGDGAGHRVRRSVGANDSHDARARADEGENAIPGGCSA